jgi:hypothetical protein
LRPTFLGGSGTAAILWYEWHKEGLDLIVIDPSISVKWRVDWSGKELKSLSRAKCVVVLKAQYSLEKNCGSG